ncbi:hypothetical protein BC830DRAFT_1154370 [Chytriomyces sp. MP71]|nr:hypothetical protein BC830DRAFT_1154370 [Chytriomyces sp. MP71]
MDRPVPQSVYKILDAAPQHPLPEQLPLSTLDQADGFIHLSNHEQIPKTAAKWFTSYDKLWLLRVDSASATRLIGKFKWLDAGETGCIHLYADNGKLNSLGSGTVVGVMEWSRMPGHTWDQIPCPQ